jgi:hypothetical protein
LTSNPSAGTPPHTLHPARLTRHGGRGEKCNHPCDVEPENKLAVGPLPPARAPTSHAPPPFVSGVGLSRRGRESQDASQFRWVREGKIPSPALAREGEKGRGREHRVKKIPLGTHCPGPGPGPCFAGSAGQGASSRLS